MQDKDEKVRDRTETDESSETQGHGTGSAPPRSMGTHGTEFGQMSDHDRSGQQGQSGTGQADLGSQSGSTLSGHADQQELGELGGDVDQPASYGGGDTGVSRSHTEGEGFILQPSSAKATGSAEEEADDDESATGPRDVGSGGSGSTV